MVERASAWEGSPMEEIAIHVIRHAKICKFMIIGDGISTYLYVTFRTTSIGYSTDSTNLVLYTKLLV